MRSVQTRDTGAELAVRRYLFGLGLRYRLNRRDLPGSPDLVFPERRIAVFVNGCFWHAHDCPKGRAPKSNEDYWLPKRQRNVQRDREKIEGLEALGWRVLTIWECEVKQLNIMASLAREIGVSCEERST